MKHCRNYICCHTLLILNFYLQFKIEDLWSDIIYWLLLIYHDLNFLLSTTFCSTLSTDETNYIVERLHAITYIGEQNWIWLDLKLSKQAGGCLISCGFWSYRIHIPRIICTIHLKLIFLPLIPSETRLYRPSKSILSFHSLELISQLINWGHSFIMNIKSLLGQ